MVLIEKKVYSEKELLRLIIQKKAEAEELSYLKLPKTKVDSDLDFYRKRYKELKGIQ